VDPRGGCAVPARQRRHGSTLQQQKRGDCAVPARRWLHSGGVNPCCSSAAAARRRTVSTRHDAGRCRRGIRTALARRLPQESGLQVSNPKSLTYCSLNVSPWFLSSVDIIPPTFLRLFPSIPFRFSFRDEVFGTGNLPSFLVSKVCTCECASLHLVKFPERRTDRRSSFLRFVLVSVLL
jgi:hypothetical protein